MANLIGPRTRRARLLGVLVIGLVAFFAGGRPAFAEKRFELVAWETRATLLSDGSMDVVEKITYTFEDGPFRRGSRTFTSDDLDKISDFQVREGEQLLTVIEPPESELDGYRWLFPAEIIDGTHTYTLQYHVDPAMSAGTDVAELYWQFLGDDHPGVGRMTIDIEVPTAAPPAAVDSAPTEIALLRAWAHGPGNGVVRLDDQSVHLEVVDVPAGTFVEARVLAPAADFDIAPSGGARLADVLADEAGFQAADAGRDLSAWGRGVAGLGGLVGASGLTILARRFGKEPKIDPLIGEYWREPLDDPPAVVLATLSKGGISTGPAMASTLLDLAQRGHLRIAEEKKERFGPDSVRHTYTFVGKPTDPTRPFEDDLLRFVFAGQSVVTGDQIADRATSNRTATNTWLETWKEHVTAEYTSRNYADSSGGTRKWLLLVGLSLLVGLCGVVALGLGSALGIVVIVGAVGIGITGGVLLSNRSVAGAEAVAKAKGLRKYIKDFSNLEEAPAGHLILWERFLVYAVALGVAKELLAGMAAKLPQIIADEKFGDWYRGPGGVSTIPGFPGSWESTTGAALQPPSASASGSGGGFSGGGGGGGGGGGAGAD